MVSAMLEFSSSQYSSGSVEGGFAHNVTGNEVECDGSPKEGLEGPTKSEKLGVFVD